MLHDHLCEFCDCRPADDDFFRDGPFDNSSFGIAFVIFEDDCGVAFEFDADAFLSAVFAFLTDDDCLDYFFAHFRSSFPDGRGDEVGDAALHVAPFDTFASLERNNAECARARVVAGGDNASFLESPCDACFDCFHGFFIFSTMMNVFVLLMGLHSTMRTVSPGSALMHLGLWT